MVTSMKIFGGKSADNAPEKQLLACCEGMVIDIKDSDDDIISSGILGEGYAVYPRYEDIQSPVGGHVVEITSPVSGHLVDITHQPETIIIKTQDGLKVLISFSGFTAAQVYITVRGGDIISAGQHIADLKLYDNNEKAVFVIVENSDVLDSFEIKKGECTADEAAAYYEL